MTTTIRLPEDLWVAAKNECTVRKCSLSELIRRSLHETLVVAKEPKKQETWDEKIARGCQVVDVYPDLPANAPHRNHFRRDGE